MNICFLAIGDELVDGATTDRNGPWLSHFLAEKGLSIKDILLTRDKKEELLKVFRWTFENYDLVITSGGLGPTVDDLTKPILGQLIKGPLKENSTAEKIVSFNYGRVNKSWTESKGKGNSYHFIPEGVTPLPNPTGIAPGLLYLGEKKAIVCLPGVPGEFRPMMEEIIFPKLSSFFSLSKKSLFKVNVKTWGIPEEKIFYDFIPKIWKDLGHLGKLASLPHSYGVELVLSSSGEPQKVKETFLNYLYSSPLKDHIWQVGDLSFEEYLLKELSSKGLTVGVVESCSGGLMSHMLTNVQGSSEVFMGGLVTYSNEAKIHFCQVKPETLEKFGAVSSQTALEMAKGGQKALGVDLCLSTSGIAGPSGGTKERPVGTVAIGWAFKERSGSEVFQFHGVRERLKERFSYRAFIQGLDLLK